MLKDKWRPPKKLHGGRRGGWRPLNTHWLSVADLEKCVRQQEFLGMLAFYYGRSLNLHEDETKLSVVSRCLSIARAFLLVAMATRCAHRFISTEMVWGEEHTSQCSLLSCADSMMRYSTGHSVKRSRCDGSG